MLSQTMTSMACPTHLSITSFTHMLVRHFNISPFPFMLCSHGSRITLSPVVLAARKNGSMSRPSAPKIPLSPHWWPWVIRLFSKNDVGSDVDTFMEGNLSPIVTLSRAR